MTGGPFPTKEADLNNYFNTAAVYISANNARLGISGELKGSITAMLTEWNTKYPPSTDANTRTKTITDEKNISKNAFIALLRSVYADIPQSAPTPADRNALNLPERSTSYTRSPVPTTRPVGSVDTSMRLQHTISFVDEGAEGNSKAKPRGVRGCQIWHKVGGTAPADLSECEYLATVTKSPYVAHYSGADAGKNVYYILCWENTRGEAGPLSETVMATITA